MNWISEMFAWEMPLEMMLRGSAIYWFLFLIFRLVLRRDVGSIGVADVLLLVLIADASQNAMAAEYKSIGDGAVLIATLVFWNLAIDWLSYRFPAVERIMAGTRICLVRDGQMMRRNMRREFITTEDLMSQLRLAGIDDIRTVRRAYMENDGKISILKR